MEPELPRPQPGTERAPVDYGQTFERAPRPSEPEQGIERSAERIEQASESAARRADTTAVAAPTLPPVVASPPIVEPVTAPHDDTPMVANDDDLIEKEWVDKAKAIIVATKDDPYEREQAVSKLQADYLKKRYGKELGAAE